MFYLEYFLCCYYAANKTIKIKLIILDTSINFSLFFMAIIGVIIALRFLLSYKSNPHSNWYIIIIFGLASLRVLHKGVFEIYNPTLYQK